MKRLKKTAVIYFYINTIFLIPALLTGIGITFPATIFAPFYFIYILLYGVFLHLHVLFAVLIYGVYSAYKCIKENKSPSVKLVSLYVVNVLVNIFGVYFGSNFMMSMK